MSEVQVADDFGVDFGEIGLPDRAVEADGVVHDEAAERRRGLFFFNTVVFSRDIPCSRCRPP